MAVYHFKMQMISRSAGRSSTAAAAYRGGLEIHDERTGRTFDYTRRDGVMDDTILAPNRAPDWARDPATLWNEVEKFERRKDAQVARENVIALPHELTPEQNKEWLHAFVQEAYVKRGMVAQVSIHAPDRDGDHRNYHSHILLTTRAVTRNGFREKKARNWNEKQTLKDWREQCADHLNAALERHGHKERVDHRSFEDQGVNREPTKHLGPAASEMEKRGEQTRIGDENRAAQDFNAGMQAMEAEFARLEKEIAKEEARLDAERRKALELQQKNRETASFAAELDKKQALEREEDRRRDQLEAELKDFYRREEVEADLRDAQERLDSAQGFFSRLIGRQARFQREVECLQQSLANIAQREGEARDGLERRLAEERGPVQVPEQANSPTPSAEPSERDRPPVAFTEAANDNVPRENPAEEAIQRRAEEIRRRLAGEREHSPAPEPPETLSEAFEASANDNTPETAEDGVDEAEAERQRRIEAFRQRLLDRSRDNERGLDI